MAKKKTTPKKLEPGETILSMEVGLNGIPRDRQRPLRVPPNTEEDKAVALFKAARGVREFGPKGYYFEECVKPPNSEKGVGAPKREPVTDA